MARLALTIAGAVAGAAIAYFSMGTATAAGIQLGMSIGALAGSIAGQLAFPGKGTHVYGPRVNDMQVTNSTPGQVIPLIFGAMRIGGNVFWSSGLTENSTTTSQGGKGGPTNSSTTYTYSISCAVGFCQGPASIIRVWGDSKLIYNGKASSGTNKGTWNGGTNYNVNDIVQYTDSSSPNATPNWYICMVGNIGQPPTNASYWAQDLVDQSPTQSTYTPPVIYPGNETQLPDSLIVSLEGASVTPAYRGVCYAVWDNLPLADFGNRFPNMRAEVASSAQSSFPSAIIGWPFTPGSNKPFYVTTDSQFATAFVWQGINGGGGRDSSAGSIMRVDLATNTVVVSSTMGMIGSVAAGQTGGTYPFVPGTDQYPGAEGVMCVDTNGYLWGKCTMSNRPFLCQMDPMSFNPVAFVDMGGVPVTDVSCMLPFLATSSSAPIGAGGAGAYIACTANNSSTPVVLVIAVGTSTFMQGGKEQIGYNPVGGFLLGQYYNFPSNIQFRQLLPTADGSGNVWWLYENSPADGNWYLLRINILSGIVVPKGTGMLPPGPLFTNITIFNYTPDAVHGVPHGMLYNFAANNLILPTNVGAFNVVDAATGQLSDQVGTATDPLFGTSTASPYYNKLIGAGSPVCVWDAASTNLVQTALKGIVQNGMIPVPSLASDNSGNNILFYAVSTFDVVQEFSWASFAAGGTPAGVQWPCTSAGSGSWAYDTASNTFLCVSDSPVPGYPGSFPDQYALYRLSLSKTSSNLVTADTIVNTICQLAGLTTDQIDTSQLAGILVEGYPITSLQAGKDMITNIAQAFYFDGRETDFKLQFIPRPQNPIDTIPETDLGLLGDNAELTETIGQEQDVPKSVEVMYIDPNTDYQQGQQKKVRHSKTKKTVNQTSISLPLVMTAVQAAQLAQKILWTAELERRTYAINFWKAYYLLFDPSDVVLFDYHGVQLQARFTQCMLGQNLAVQTQLISEDQQTYVAVATGTTSGFVGQTLQNAANTQLFLLDIPYLQDTDADATGNIGYYALMAPQGGGKWTAGVLYTSSDAQSFQQIDATTTAITYGRATTALPAPPLGPNCWDFESTLTIQMVNGDAPSSTSRLNVLNGANQAVLYPSLEVINFTTVTTNADGTITLSGFLRGRRGTESFITGHAVGENVFFTTESGASVRHEQMGLSVLNLLRYFKGVSVGKDLNAATTQQFTNTGRDLRPYSPTYGKVAAISGGLQLTWLRRTRLGGGWNDGIGLVPLAEDSEQYSVDIVNGAGTVVRTIDNIIPPGGVQDTWTSPAQPNVTYTTAMQTADGYTAGNGWTAVIYQISGEVGRGFPETVALP